MRSLPSALRAYIWAVCLACVAIVAVQVAPYLRSGMLWRLPPVVLASAGLFLLLVCVGEVVMLQIGDDISQSLATTAQIAAILLLPAPLPLMVALGAVVVSQFSVRKPLYKRAFNVCHTTLTVGLSGAWCSLAMGPLVVLRRSGTGDVAATSTVLGVGNTSLAALGLLVALYYLHDAGLMTPVLVLAEGRPPWLVWRDRQLPSLLPELAASTFGILAAIAWGHSPFLIALFVLPVVALRAAFRAIRQAEERAIALRRRGEQLEAVLAVGERLQLQQPQAELLLPVLEAARAVAGAMVAAAYLRDPDEPTMLERVILVPLDARNVGPSRLPAPAASVGMYEPWRHDPDWDDERALIVPLEREGDSVVGLLRLGGIDKDFGHDEREALAILATQAAIALQNTRLHERALAQASQDGLTGLLNHRAFQTRLEEEVGRAHRSGRPLALLMVDLDDFGVINNTYGHQTGDATLIAIAAALRDSLRGADVAARYGGDEFAVILPETEGDEARAVAARVRAAIAGLTVMETGVMVSIDASVGIAALPDHARTREGLVRAADGAAYAAKHAGKGRVGRPEDATLQIVHDPDVLAAQLEHANMATVEALAAAVDAKDPYTRGHSQRVSAYATILAEALAYSPATVARVRLAGLLHDVGKIGVPDAILSKPGKLTDEEFAVLKEHSAAGERMLAAVPFLRDILPAIRHHHERWDGRGYPDGLAGGTIPHDAAILMVADSFDAMTSSRVYRPALPADEAYRRIREGSGTQFNPRIVDAFERAVAAGTFVPLAPLTPLASMAPVAPVAHADPLPERSRAIHVSLAG